MKVKTLSALAGLGGALIMTTSASAAYTGLSVVNAGAATGGRTMFRVYANFTDALDGVTFVFGSPTASAMDIQSRNNLDSGVGGNFYNPLSLDTSPSAVQVFGGPDNNTNAIPATANAAFETFCTIGISNTGQAPGGTEGAGVGVNGADATTLSPNVPAWLPFITGNQLLTTVGGWYTAGIQAQGRAGYAADGDAPLRVLIMQLTVSSTSVVKGTVNLSGVLNTGLAGEQSFTLSGQTFAGVFVPAPGALALLGLAGLVGSRRRRA